MRHVKHREGESEAWGHLAAIGEAGTRGLRRVCLAGPTATRCSGDSLFSTRTRAERSILQPKAEWECLVLCQLWSEMDA